MNRGYLCLYAKENEMVGNKRFIFLAEKFYQQYPAEQYPELEQKRDRPYIQIWVTIDGVNFAIPLRSSIHHPFVFWTDEEQHCGVDFSKAVVLPDESYINESITPHLRDNEFAALYNKDYMIERQMRRYIQKYKRAKANLQKPFNRKLVSFSTLQYFEEEIANIN